MQDIRHYSDEELSLLFLNDEYLCSQLYCDWDRVKELCNRLFIYTDEQINDLKETWEQNQEDEG